MGKTSGCVLILAGLAVGSYALYPDFRSALQASGEIAAGQDEPAGVSDRAAAFVKAVLKVTGGSLPGADKPAASDASRQAPQSSSQSAPKLPASEPSKGGAGDPAKLDKMGPPAPGVVPPPDLVPPVPVPAKRPRAAVASVKVDEAPPRVPVGDATAGPRPQGAALARQIQVQLKRVGCYRGDVTDVWTPAVRQAMRDFTERANASLPVNEPDPVLLAMLQSHAPGTCSESCPQGQERAGGRCVPSVLAGLKDGGRVAARERAGVKAASGAKSGVGVAKDGSANAKAAKASAHADAGKRRSGPPPSGGGVAPEETVTGSAAGPEGRMSLAGPTATDAPLARRPQAGARRQARSAGVSRSGHSRRAYRPSYGKGYTTGLPSWALPFFLQ